MKIIAACLGIYFVLNALYIAKRYYEEGDLTLRQIIIGVLAGIPAFLGAIFLVWGLPTILPEKFRVGGDRIKE